MKLTSTPDTDQSQLELATMDALRGSQDLKDRLLLHLSTGAPSISDLAYAVKVRVKEDYKIIGKVAKKREGVPSYDVATLRDIIGLRVVTLYRMDALRIIPLLLEAIDSSPDAGPFKRGSLEEIRVYSTNPHGDAQGLSGKLERLFKDQGYADRVEFVQTPSNYTSIHMVAWGWGKYQDQYRKLPIEIQIRTAFEDAWGEIEHSLKYKRKELPAVAPELDRLASSFAHLNVLKSLVDGVAQYADQIKIQLREMEVERTRSSYTRTAEEPLVRLSPLRDLPQDIKQAVQLAVGRSKPVLEGGPTLPLADRLEALEESLADLRRVKADLEGITISEKTRRETNYVVDMQIALHLFEIGNSIEDGREQLSEASSIYLALEEALPNRLVVLYRHAKVLDALGRHDGALERLRKVVARLEEKREPTPAKHWIRAAAPKVLGVVLWEEARRVRAASSGAGSREEIALLTEAYEVTKQAFTKRVGTDPTAPADRPSARAQAANNLLYYALEMADAKQAIGESHRLPQGEVLDFLKEMGAEDPEAVTDHRALDTARRAFSYLGEHEKARTCAERYLASVEHLAAGKQSETPAIREATAAARALLSGE